MTPCSCESGSCAGCRYAALIVDGLRDLGRDRTCPTTPAVPKPVPHDHTEYVEGCFRCDLSREETRVTSPGALRLGSCCINVGTDECVCENPTNYGLDACPTAPASPKGASDD